MYKSGAAELGEGRGTLEAHTAPGGVKGKGWMCGEFAFGRQERADALGCLAGPRDGVGDQVRYLRLRVAPAGAGVNAGRKDFW